MIEVVLRVRIAQPCVVCDEGSESFPSSPLPPPPPFKNTRVTGVNWQCCMNPKISDRPLIT